MNVNRRRMSRGIFMLLALLLYAGCSSKGKMSCKGNEVKMDTIMVAVPDSVWNASDSTEEVEDRPVRIGVAWRRDQSSTTFTGVLMAIKEAGAEPVIINMVKDPNLPYNGKKLSSLCLDRQGVLRQRYADMVKRDSKTDIGLADTLADIDAMVFPGGEDMSPTLFAVPEPWHGIESEIYYDSTRDVSDYLLMRWCLDHDMPSLCICRGMQVLCILSDVPLIQDIARYFRLQGKAYNHIHRGLSEGKRRFARHDVTVTDSSSLLFEIAGTGVIRNVPSWHHQSARPVLGDHLKITAETTTNGIRVVEGVERTDKRFFIGVQYHPEIAVKKHLENAIDAPFFMSYEEGMKYFEALVQKARE